MLDKEQEVRNLFLQELGQEEDQINTILNNNHKSKV